MTAVSEMPRAMPSQRRPSSHGVVRERLARVERERIVDIQRARILAAMSQVTCERGAHNVTVAHVVERAGVSRRTFYETFADTQDCLLAALEHALGCAAERVGAAYESHERWRERIRAALAASLELFDEEPHLARLLVVESLNAGEKALRRRAEVLHALTEAVDAARGELQARVESPPRLTAEGVVGAVLSVLHTRLSGRDSQPLSTLLNPLMSMIVLPYLGSAAARRELARPVAIPMARAGRSESAQLRSDPFKDAGMRMTYRTMRVLSVIAAHPGFSNRRIGAAAGVSDQGQMSKLLARLQRLGLVSNNGAGHAQGEPNAWVLTPAGRMVQLSIRNHTEGAQ
jgi:AcrR family transcriptional regulator